MLRRGTRPRSCDGEREVSDTTMGLLQHWFRREPHIWSGATRPTLQVLAPPAAHWSRRSSTCTRCAASGAVEQLYATGRIWRRWPTSATLGPSSVASSPPGSGKTKMMSLLIAWCLPQRRARAGRELRRGAATCILIAPGLFVRDRLFQDFFPPAGGPSVFTADPVVPPSMRAGLESQGLLADDLPAAARPRRWRPGGDQLPPAPSDPQRR
jgi:hypothetical protein